MANTALFTQFFVDFVQALFFRFPEEKFTINKLLIWMPEHLKDEEMLNGAVQILVMQEKVDLTDDNGTYYFQASADGIKQWQDENETKRLEAEINLRLKKAQSKTLWWEIFKIQYWYLILFVGFALGLLKDWFIGSESSKKDKSSTIQQPITPTITDTSLNHRKP